MTDYIKREDAIKAFDPRQRQDWYTPWIVETLNDLPSADVAPVRHGRWMMKEKKLNDVLFYVQECSECGAFEAQIHNMNYCPNCGAKMDEEETK